MGEEQGNLKTATGDENLKDIFHSIRTTKTPAVINYGASWEALAQVKLLSRGKVQLRAIKIVTCKDEGCRVCNQILPTFQELIKKFPKLSFIYADIDECPETTQNIRYTPTFHFYRDGERVDEMFGGGEERLHDRLWLHS